MTTRQRLHPTRSTRYDGVRVAAAFGGCYLAVTVAATAGVPAPAAVLLVALLVGVCSVGAGAPAALGSALLGWLFVTGFVVNRDGVLRLTGSADVVRLVVLLAVALAVAGATRVLLRHHARTGGRVTVPAPPEQSLALASRRVV